MAEIDWYKDDGFWHAQAEALLKGPEGEELRLCVKRGAGFFEDIGEDDWAERMVEAVDNNTFDLTCPSNCAVGTILGWYYDHFTSGIVDLEKGRRSHHDAMELGFHAGKPESMSRENRDRIQVRWVALEQAWVDLARERADG